MVCYEVPDVPKQKKRLQANKVRSEPRSRPPLRILAAPFAEVSEAQRIAFLQAQGENFAEQFDVTFRSLQERIADCNPFALLAAFSYYALTTTMQNQRQEWATERPLVQHHVELLQALILQHHLSAFADRPVLSANLEAIHDLVHGCTQAYGRRRQADMSPALSEEERSRFWVQHTMRGHTLAIRNWGYMEQVVRIVKELFAPLDDAIEHQLGVRVEGLVIMCQNVLAAAEDRLNKHREALITILRCKTVRAAVEQYCGVFLDNLIAPEDLVTTLDEHGTDLHAARFFLISHSDTRLPSIFTFTFDDFLSAYPGHVDPDQLRQILDNWSLPFGALADANPEHFFLGNPIWQKPLVRCENNTYFWPILGIFQSFALPMMERIVSLIPDLQDRYEKCRGRFLEEQVEWLFKQVFPMAHVYAGSKWDDPMSGEQFENDLLVVIDAYLIVVESKAAKVTEAARRGTPDRLQRTIKDLVVKASQQGERFAAYLQTHPGRHTFATGRGTANEVDTSEVHQVIRLNVTLETVGDLTARMPDLLRAGYIQAGVSPAPTLTLADLELAFDLLDGACQKLHYLFRRAEFEAHADYFADEMDLLAFYLDTGFNIGEMEFDGTPLFLYGLSQRIDPYFMARGSGGRVAKPRLRLTQWWRDLVRYREQRQGQIPRWSEAGCLLLDVPVLAISHIRSMWSGCRGLGGVLV